MTHSASITRPLLMASLALASFTHAAETPNPAAVFCAEQGGAYRVVKETGGERGICVLQDGQEIDAWGYFRERHASPSQEKAPTAEATQTDGGAMTEKQLAGGWTPQDPVSEEAAAALNWVLGQVNTAAGLRTIRGVWTQVVAGLNYAVEFELDNDEVWHTVVFRDLDGRFHLAQPAQLGPRPTPYRHQD